MEGVGVCVCCHVMWCVVVVVLLVASLLSSMRWLLYGAQYDMSCVCRVHKNDICDCTQKYSRKGVISMTVLINGNQYTRTKNQA